MSGLPGLAHRETSPTRWEAERRSVHQKTRSQHLDWFGLLLRAGWSVALGHHRKTAMRPIWWGLWCFLRLGRSRQAEACRRSSGAADQQQEVCVVGRALGLEYHGSEMFFLLHRDDAQLGHL